MASLPQDANTSIESTIDLTWDTLSSLPTTAGIYYVYSPESELLYIGQTVNFKSRFRQHFTVNRFFTKRLRLRLELIPDSIERIRKERRLIREHKPRLNIASTHREYNPITTVCDVAAFHFIQTDPEVAKISAGPSWFGPKCVRVWNHKPRALFSGENSQYVASPLQSDGSVKVTRNYKDAYITNCGREWHLLKYYFRQIPGVWSHECVPPDRWFGRWEYTGQTNEIHLWLKKHYTSWTITLHGFESRDVETEYECLRKIGAAEHIDTMWEAITAITGVQR